MIYCRLELCWIMSSYMLFCPIENFTVGEAHDMTFDNSHYDRLNMEMQSIFIYI